MLRHLAILTGGTSSERAIALASAESVRRAIGRLARTEVFDFPKDLDDFLRRRKNFDCAIPVFHGRGGEDGAIQGFLDTLGMPYTFSSVGGHALAMNKAQTNEVVRFAGLRVPASTILLEPADLPFRSTVIIKPNDGGSSVGVTIAHNQAELTAGIRQAFTHAPAVIVEDYIVGDEYSVAVADVQGQTKALPVISIVSKHEFFDYDSKYTPGLAEERCPADIPDALAQQLQAAAMTAHHTLGLRHVSRSDFMVDQQGLVWFLETNTIPGMSVLLPKAIQAASHDFGRVLIGWAEDAIRQTRV